MVADTSVIAINYVNAYKETGTGGVLLVPTMTATMTLVPQNENYIHVAAQVHTQKTDTEVLARAITNGLRIRVLYEDNDVGDQTGTRRSS